MAAHSPDWRFVGWRWSSATITGFGFLVCIVLWLLTDAEGMHRLMSEGGPVEWATAAGYGIAAIVLLIQANRDRRFFFSSAFIAGLFMGRELDLDHYFTSESVLALRFYSFTTVPLAQKLIVAPIVLVLAVFVLDYARRYGAALVRGLAERRAEAWTIANVILLLAYSVLIDGFSRKMRGMFGIELPQPQAGHLLAVLEEGMELVIPLLLLWAVLQAFATRRRSGIQRASSAPSPQS